MRDEWSRGSSARREARRREPGAREPGRREPRTREPGRREPSLRREGFPAGPVADPRPRRRPAEPVPAPQQDRPLGGPNGPGGPAQAPAARPPAVVPVRRLLSLTIAGFATLLMVGLVVGAQ